MITINGKVYDEDEMTFSTFLDQNGYDQRKIAVELNGEILSKHLYGATILHHGDCVEIVCFVGGG